MYRVSVMSSGAYAVKVDSVFEDFSNIQPLVDSEGMVILVDELESLEAIGINSDDVTVVDPE